MDLPLKKPITSYTQIQDLGRRGLLTQAEKRLLARCRRGEALILNGGERPDHPGLETEIRASLLRYLILGGCKDCRVHEWGVQLVGAYIFGPLDLSFAEARGATGLFACRFDKPIAALQARFEFLNLSGSAFPGLNAQGAKIAGEVFLSEADTKGEVSFSGAEIGGQLNCASARLSNEDGDAVNAQNAKIAGHVILKEAEAQGEVRFSNAEVGGQLNCTGAGLSNEGGLALNAQGAKIADSVFLNEADTKGGVRLPGAEIGGQLECTGARLCNEDGRALQAQRAVIKSGFVWREMEEISGTVDLTSAHASDLVDDTESWDKVNDLVLDNFTYGTLVGPLDPTFRKGWLKKGAWVDGEFHPQPYQQLAKLLRERGHRPEAREILVEMEIQQRKATRLARTKSARGNKTAEVNASHRNVFDLLWDHVRFWTSGYGFHPHYSLIWILLLILTLTALSHLTLQIGDFAPNSDVVLTSAGWTEIARDTAGHGNPAKVWAAGPGAANGTGPGRDYQTFFSPYYAADVVIPLIDLGQTDAWAPSTTRGWWGFSLFYAEKVFTALGWIVTAFFAAALTGSIRRED